MSKLKNSFWNTHGFEVIFFISIIIFIFLFIFRDTIERYLQDKIDDPEFHSLLSVNKPKKRILNKNESRCREIFEYLFNKQFPNCRPNFMTRKNTGKKLELDGYNKDLNLAFEYNGIQHYKFTNMFHKNYDDFLKQLQRDNEKRELCLLNNIKLIEIPYTVKYSDLYTFILKKLESEGYNF